MVNTIFLIGAPCDGKTTVGFQLQEQFGFKLIQMSEILSANGGDSTPSHIIYQILKQKLSSLESNEIAIIDGSPKTMESVLQWGIREYSPICAIYFECHSHNQNVWSMEKLKLTSRVGVLYCISANRNKNQLLKEVCMILAREFHNRNILKDQIILTRIKTVIDKGVEKLIPPMDQERINVATLSVSKVLSVSH